MFNAVQNIIKSCAILVMTLLLTACGKSDENTYQPSAVPMHPPQVTEYVIGIHPLHNPQRLMELYGPIVDYINLKIPEAHIKLEASRNYDEFDKKLYAGHFAFAMPNPYETLLSLKHGYRVIGKMANDEDFHGIILVRKDSGIRTVKDLKGKVVAFPAKTALIATMQPQYYLHTHGIDVNRDIECLYVGSQESSIMNVYRGHVAAGATWPVPWRLFVAEHPEMADELVVKWQTEKLPSVAWVVRSDIPLALADRFSKLLFSLHESEEGRLMLSRLPLSRFEPATEATYQPVREFLEKFSTSVRPIEH